MKAILILFSLFVFILFVKEGYEFFKELVK